MSEGTVGKDSVLHGSKEVFQPAEGLRAEARIELIEEHQRHLSEQAIIADAMQRAHQMIHRGPLRDVEVQLGNPAFPVQASGNFGDTE